MLAGLSLALVFSLSSCGGSNSDAPAGADTASESASEEGGGQSEDNPFKAMEKAAEEIEKQMSGDGEKAEVVDFRKLKSLLPAKMAGLSRTDHGGEKVGMMGFKMSTAQATYGEGEKQIEAAIIDFAGVGMAMASLASWSTLEIDRESDEGYERTTTIGGHKAFEKYDAARQEGQVSIIMNDRILVTLEGQGITDSELREALSALDLDAIGNVR